MRSKTLNGSANVTVYEIRVNSNEKGNKIVNFTSLTFQRKYVTLLIAQKELVRAITGF